MRIAFNPSTVAALITPPNNKDITFDLRGHNIFARGVKFCGTDTNTWRDIKINNVSIGSNTLDLRNGSNTTLTNTNGVVTINSTWRPVVDNLTSDSTTSSLSANLGRILKALIDGKSDSGHNHDDRYLKLTGGTMASNALITFADSGSLSTDKGPQGARGGLYWTGQSDYAKLYAEETAGDNLDLVIQFGDDNSNGLSIRNEANTQTSYISAGGVITTGTFKGNLDWSYITNKPATATRWPSWDEIANKPNTFTPSNHNHDERYVRAFNTSNDNINSDWGQSFKTFDPIPSGTPPELNPNISILNIGENFDRRKLLAFIYSNDNIYYRRHVDGSFTNWRRLAFANEIPTSLKNPYALTISLNGTSQGPYDGSAAKNINITPSSIGAATSDHTHSWTSITDKLVTGNEFNIVNAGFNGDMWFNYVPINDRSKTATINSYYFGNGHQGLASVTASGFAKNGSSSSYVLLGDGDHKAESSLRVAYASNADMVDGYHENSFLRYRGDTSTDLEATLWSLIGIKEYYGALPDGLTDTYNWGGVISLPGTHSRFEIYASHLSSNGNGLYYRSGWGSDKKTWLKFIDSSTIGSQTVANAYHLRINSANTWSTWYWAGLSGLPSWLWGSNDGINMYVWNPSNFNVNTALYLRSLGNLNCQTGRTLNYGDVYTYNTYDGNTGSPTTFTSVIGFGRGIDGTVEIAGGWNNTNLYWRSLRDCCEDWHSWRTVLDSSNYTEFINNYYWANVKISTSSSTTTSPTVSNLTATSSIRMGNIYLLNTDEINNSANGSIYLNYRNSGNVSLCYGGGNVGIGTTTPSYKLDVNGLMRASGFHHGSVNSDDYMLLAGGGYKSFGGDSSHPVFLGYLNLDHGSDGTVSSSFSCLGYTVPFTYTRGGSYCAISINDTTHQVFYIKAAIASVNYSGGGMNTWTGEHRGDGAWWLHCYAYGDNGVRVKGFRNSSGDNDGWWGGNPLYSDSGSANAITVCLFGYVAFR